MYGRGHRYDTFMGHIIPHGCHHGTGVTDHIGIVPGGRLFIMTIIHIGGHITATIRLVIHIGWFSLTEFTDRTEVHL